MFKRTIGILLTCSLFCLNGLYGQNPDKTMSLSLEQCIVRALENNLNVAISVLNPQLSEVSLAASKDAASITTLPSSTELLPSIRLSSGPPLKPAGSCPFSPR